MEKGSCENWGRSLILLLYFVCGVLYCYGKMGWVEEGTWEKECGKGSRAVRAAAEKRGKDKAK